MKKKTSKPELTERKARSTVEAVVICPICKKLKPKEEIQKRRRGCNYLDDESNWLISCDSCIEEDTKYWIETNQEYINTVMGSGI